MADSFPSVGSPQRLGSPRSKVSLKPGRSLMDWIRLGNSGKDLQGFGGKFRKVSTAELAEHNSIDDVWICLRGCVYNITPYLEYHPGGIPEIMKGAGIDATQLFNEIHQWVNAESMLQKCLVGPLVQTPKEKKKSGTGSYKSSLSLLAPPIPLVVKSKDDTDSNEDSLYWRCEVKSIVEVTHNVKMFCFTLPNGLVMDAPVGHHVHFQRTISGIDISRPYTIVVPSFDFKNGEETKRHLYLIIKIYPSGTLTPSLLDVNIGDHCLLTGYSGNFQSSRLTEAKDIIMIAGGTGLTPMIRIIHSFIHQQLSSVRTIKLLFANREEKDIIWRDNLDQLQKEIPEKFQIYYFLSSPPESWSGHTGRITESFLKELLPPSPQSGCEKDLLICVCGPDPFTLQQLKFLKSLGYNNKSTHAFFG
ncbi:cytochrome b5 reductase 4 isoform X2 [Paramuricea clavata]|uniref:Cytochrome b5 reductase 4 isoform X2 n=1 Tax=Paramuricea clavata TaxID=317549 RepID=A0A7D9DW21_PARCT|nr:cytochrome b5 reductase 4 isoform X2 [Paramuricea clavata]